MTVVALVGNDKGQARELAGGRIQFQVSEGSFVLVVQVGEIRPRIVLAAVEAPVGLAREVAGVGQVLRVGTITGSTVGSIGQPGDFLPFFTPGSTASCPRSAVEDKREKPSIRTRIPRDIPNLFKVFILFAPCAPLQVSQEEDNILLIRQR